MVIINHGLQTMTNEVIIPHSGWEHEPNEDSKPRDAEWTTVFKNTSGCLRSVIHPAHVASPVTGFILGPGYKSLTLLKAPNAEVLQLNQGRQLADWFGLQSLWMTLLQKRCRVFQFLLRDHLCPQTGAAFMGPNICSCSTRIAFKFSEYTENLRHGRCRASARGPLQTGRSLLMSSGLGITVG